MTTVELALTLAIPIVATHLVPLQRTAARAAALAWLFALALRASASIAAALFVLLYVPQTQPFEAAAQWCWHAVLPLTATHLSVGGHSVAHLALFLPALTLVASLLALGLRWLRAWFALRRLLRRALGKGPLGCTVIPEAPPLVAAAGFGRGRIVLSAAALDALDGRELEAAVAHELGHLRRHHRPLLLAGSIFRVLGLALPGTRAAERALRFHLERDADEFAVSRTHDPLALASAICKAASARQQATLGLPGGGEAVARRLNLLIEQPRAQRARRLWAGAGLAGLLAAIVLMVAVALTGWALAAPGEPRHDARASRSC